MATFPRAQAVQPPLVSLTLTSPRDGLTSIWPHLDMASPRYGLTSIWSGSVDLRSAIRSRRMVRDFSGEPVSRETLDSLLDLAVRAPSAGNTAGREFIVLEGPETARFWESTTTAR